MQEHGVVPELECFDLGMINYGKYLIKKESYMAPITGIFFLVMWRAFNRVYYKWVPR